MKYIKYALVLVTIVSATVVAWWLWQNRPIPDFGRKVLVFSKTSEYRHQSIGAGIEAITELGRRAQFNVVSTEDASQFTDKNLRQFESVIFLNTTGDVLDNAQQRIFERYIQAGGGYLGIHAAADTEYKQGQGDWHWYTRLVGGAFLSHPNNPNVRTGELTVRDKSHSATRSMTSNWTKEDEWYDFQRFSSDVTVLITVDEASYFANDAEGRGSGAIMGAGEQHPVSWYHAFDGGRAFYTAMGHTFESYSDPQFMAHIHGALQYTMQSVEQIDYTRSFPQAWRFKRRVLSSPIEDEPIAIDFNDLGELYYIGRRGGVFRYDEASGKSIKVVQFDVDKSDENGLIGFAFDPSYSTNHWVYFYRTQSKANGLEQVLSRFELDNGQLLNEMTMLEIPSDAGCCHTAGTLEFDAGGNLWMSTGDNTNPHGIDGYNPHDQRQDKALGDAGRSSANTQDLRGKILRIKPLADGSYSIPEGNLFIDSRRGRPEIYIMGNRNPYRFSVDNHSGYLYWGEIGPDANEDSSTRGPKGYDEINRTRAPGNFGWPYLVAENLPYAYYDFANGKPTGQWVAPGAPQNTSPRNTGLKILPPAQPAWIAYPYDLSQRYYEFGAGGRNAMVAPVYYDDDFANSDIKFPTVMNGRPLIYDFMRGWLFSVAIDEEGDPEAFHSLLPDYKLRSAIDMTFGPDGALYILEYGSGWFSINEDSALSRIEYYAGENPPPVALATADRQEGRAPLMVAVSAEKSFDRDQDPLSYYWYRSDAETPFSEDIRTTVTLTEPGEQNLRLKVVDSDGAEHETSLVFVVGNDRPLVTIKMSGNTSFFWPDEISREYVIQVEDTEDGSSESGAIANSQVHTSIGFVSAGDSSASGHEALSIGPARGEGLMQQADCLGCHKSEAASIGPDFASIAARYRGGDGTRERLAQSTISGSSGIWGDAIMPAHPDLSLPEARSIASYILSFGDGSTGTESILGGILHFNQHIEADAMGVVAGVYHIEGSYADKGANGVPALTGSKRIELVWPKLRMDAADGGDLNMLFDIPDNEMIPDEARFLIGEKVALARGGSHLFYSNLDLSGIHAIDFDIVSSRLITSGGTLQLRLDSPGGEILGSIEVDAGLSMENKIRTITLARDFDGRHDLYLLFVGEESEMLFVVISMEFRKA